MAAVRFMSEGLGQRKPVPSRCETTSGLPAHPACPHRAVNTRERPGGLATVLAAIIVVAAHIKRAVAGLAHGSRRRLIEQERAVVAYYAAYLDAIERSVTRYLETAAPDDEWLVDIKARAVARGSQLDRVMRPPESRYVSMPLEIIQTARP
jgi:hypothetical protein